MYVCACRFPLRPKHWRNQRNHSLTHSSVAKPLTHHTHTYIIGVASGRRVKVCKFAQHWVQSRNDTRTSNSRLGTGTVSRLTNTYRTTHSTYLHHTYIIHTHTYTNPCWSTHRKSNGFNRLWALWTLNLKSCNTPKVYTNDENLAAKLYWKRILA